MWPLLLLGSLLQQPGRTTFDTKFDLTADPGGLLARSLHLWNPQSSFGELQNQAYGYLFPQGPWFLGAELLGMPDWVAQRLWSGLLLVLAYEGCRQVARAMRLPATAGILAGLVYALSPRLLGASGVLSGEILPSVFLPWAVLPLVLVGAGRWSPRTGALLSGVAVLAMSGVNAVGTLATLPAALAVVLAQWRRPHGRRLLGWWLVATGLACAWWLVPLLLLGRYSPPFLDYIETSAATTSTTGWSNAVRGTDHWLNWSVTGDRAWWPGAHELATTPALILLGAIVAAIGLVGLAHRRMPWRGALLTTAVVGLLCLTAGAAARGGSLVDLPVRGLLDGMLAPLRNVHKVDPLVRFALALGFGHGAMLLAEEVGRRRPGWQPGAVRRGIGAVLALTVLAGAAPLWNGHLRMAGWRDLPSAWSQTADWLAGVEGSRAIVVPGSGFGLQRWGWTVDEPLQGVARSPWVTRSQVPLVPGPTARWLDAVEQRLASGEGSPALASFLARAGVTHVVLRRDIDQQYADSGSVARAESALQASPGLAPVASFGNTEYGQPMVDVFAVGVEAPRVSLTSAAALRHLNGAPEDLLRAAETGLLAVDEPTVIDGAAPAQGSLVGDGYRRQERQFGRVHDAVGATLTAAEPYQFRRPAHDFAGVEGVPSSVRTRDSRVEVDASSSVGYADALGPIRPAAAPGAAYDGDAGTAWRSAPFTDPGRQWLRLRTQAPLPRPGTVLVRFAQDADLAAVRQVAVRMGGTTRVLAVPETGVIAAPVPADGVRTVRIDILRADDDDSRLGTVGVAEVVLPGNDAGQTITVPGELAAGTDLVLGTQPPRRPCLDAGGGARCDDDSTRYGEELALDRTVRVTEAGRWRVTGTVLPQPGAPVAALLAPVGRAADVVADRVFAGDPAVAGVFAFDGRPETAWLSEPGDTSAILTWSWPGRARTIDRLRITAASQPSRRPAVAELRSGHEVRTVRLDGLGTFEPLRVEGRLEIEFRTADETADADLPLGIAEVELSGAERLRHAPDRDGTTGADCGLGPAVVVDGIVHHTRVRGTVGDLLRGTPLAWEVCDRPVALSPGVHRIQVRPTLQFTPATLALDALDGPETGPLAQRSFELRDWGDTRRTVRVGPGEESVLRVAENVNPGWAAELDGTPLRQVTIDGWQQGYVVPAGAGGDVQLTFTPDRTYRAGLGAGAGLALILLLGALVGAVRERRRPESGHATPGPAWQGRWSLWWGCGLLLTLAGGPWAGVGWLLSAWLTRRPLALLAGTALLAAGAGAAIDAPGQPGQFANATAAAAVGLLVGGVARRRRLRITLAVRPRIDRLTAAALLLVAGQVGLRWVLASGSWFWQDDFLHLALAHRLGLSEEFLVRDYSGHLEVGQYAVFWLLSGLSGDFTAAALFLVGSQLLVSLLLWGVLRTLFRPSPWLLVPFAAYLFTPLGLITGAWWAAGMQAFPLQLFLLGTLLGVARLHRGGPHATAWGLLALVAHALGLLFWEKALLILPAVLATYLLVVLAGRTIGDRLRVLLAGWRWWLAHLLGWLGYVAVYLHLTASGPMASEREVTLLELVRVSVLQMTVPGMFGLPWHVDGAENSLYADTGTGAVILAAGLLGLLFLASLLRGGWAALGGWVLVIGCLVADLGLLVVGRGEYLGLVARDPRYVTDWLPLAVIGISAAFAVPRRHRRGRRVGETRTGRSGEPWRRPLALGALVLLSALTSSIQLLPVVQRDIGEGYVARLESGLGDGDTLVLATNTSYQVSVSTRTPDLFEALGRQQAFDQPGLRAVMPDSRGQLLPVRLAGALQARGDEPDCGWRLGTTPVELMVLGDTAEARLARVDLFLNRDAVLHLRSGDLEQAVAVRGGLHSAWMRLPTEAGAVEAWFTPWPGARERLPRQCLTEITVGTPWPEE